MKQIRNAPSWILAAVCWAACAHAAEGTNEYDCLIEARTTAEIRSPVEGLIEQVPVAVATSSKGQMVVTLESGPERAALAIARRRRR